MRVLLVSKYLRQLGGVETYVGWLSAALADAGHEVALLGMDEPAGSSALWRQGQRVWFSPSRDFHGSLSQKVGGAALSVYAPGVRRLLDAALREFRPDAVHFHGTCYQLTPSVFASVRAQGVPALLTAHEYKLVCANQRLWDDSRGQECYACVGLSPRAKAREVIRRRCVKASAGPSVLAALEQPLSQALVRKAGIRFHAPSRYMESVLRADGYSPESVHYADLPWTPAKPAGNVRARTSIVYIGRLAVEKGVDRLLRAWPTVAATWPGVRLRVAGDGPERPALESLAGRLDLDGVEFTGRYEPHELDSLLSDALATVHPSVWAENSPFTVRESLMRGVPALVSDRGGLPEMVSPATGSVVDPDDVAHLAAVIAREIATPRAGSEELAAAVELRRVTAERHLDWLTGRYANLGASG
ncbi:glycosyltransferase [Streptomyces sp. NPDC086549]|uniref:glycosyltransferase n=1 Tax=Streptomyces sp. NPDC086549 TaxID=3365752 RepID=UPI003826A01B